MQKTCKNNKKCKFFCLKLCFFVKKYKFLLKISICLGFKNKFLIYNNNLIYSKKL